MSTRRMIPVFAQIVQQLPGRQIERLAGGQKIKTWAFSYSSQPYLLMLGQFLQASSMNEIADIAEVHGSIIFHFIKKSPSSTHAFTKRTSSIQHGVISRYVTYCNK